MTFTEIPIENVSKPQPGPKIKEQIVPILLNGPTPAEAQSAAIKNSTYLSTFL